MLVCKTSIEMAFQPETEGERTALSWLRLIYRSPAEIRFPSPHWEDPGAYPDLEEDGNDALVFTDGHGAEEADERDLGSVPADNLLLDEAPTPTDRHGANRLEGRV